MIREAIDEIEQLVYLVSNCLSFIEDIGFAVLRHCDQGDLVKVLINLF